MATILQEAFEKAATLPSDQQATIAAVVFEKMELYLKAKLDRAEAAVARGEVISQEEVVERSRQWFK
jgi:hypothetical protein